MMTERDLMYKIATRDLMYKIATIEQRVHLSRPLNAFDRALIVADLLETKKQEALDNIMEIREKLL